MGEQAELTVGNAISYGEGEIEEDRGVRYLPSTAWPEGEIAVLENRYNVTRSTAKKAGNYFAWETFDAFLAFVNDRAPAGYLPSTWRMKTDLDKGLGYTPETITLKPGPKARALAMGGESTRKRKKKPEASDEMNPARIIREATLDGMLAAGLSPDDLDEASFSAAEAALCSPEGEERILSTINNRNIEVSNMATVKFPLKDGALDWINYWKACKAQEAEANEARRGAEETLRKLYAEEFEAALATLGVTGLSKSASLGGELDVSLEKELKVDQAGAVAFLSKYPVYAGLVLKPEYKAVAKGVFSIVGGGGEAAEDLKGAIEIKVKGSTGVLFSVPK